jgi:hypothetical protein
VAIDGEAARAELRAYDNDRLYAEASSDMVFQDNILVPMNVDDVILQKSPEAREVEYHLMNLDPEIDDHELSIERYASEIENFNGRADARSREIGTVRLFLHDHGIWQDRDLAHHREQASIAKERLQDHEREAEKLKAEWREVKREQEVILRAQRQEATQELEDIRQWAALAREIIQERDRETLGKEWHEITQDNELDR